MGGTDKMRIRIGGATILERVLTRLRPQCARLILNANTETARFNDPGLLVVADSVPDFPGPLAGILSGLDFAAAQTPEIGWIVRAERLPVPAARSGAASASSTPRCRRDDGLRGFGGRRHPVIAVCPRPCARTAARSPRKAPKSANGARDTLSQLRTGPSRRSTCSLMSHAGRRRRSAGWRHAFRTLDRVPLVPRTSRRHSDRIRACAGMSGDGHHRSDRPTRSDRVVRPRPSARWRYLRCRRASAPAAPPAAAHCRLRSRRRSRPADR